MKRKIVLLLVLVTAMAAGVIACSRVAGSDKQREMDEALRGVLSGPTPQYATQDPEGSRLWKQTKAFYERRKFAAAWVDKAKPRPQIEDLMESLREADREGLDPHLYNVSMLETRHKEASKGFLSDKGFEPREAGALDVWLTYLYMKYASDLADGLSDLSRTDPTWKIQPEKFDPLAHLEKALSENRVAESLRELRPQAPEYEALKKTLADYRAAEAKGGWPRVPETLKLKPGQRSPHVAALAKRLAATGEFTGTIPGDGQPTVYDGALVEAVKTFQRRHGLADDGGVGREVVAELNVPVQARIESIRMNLERWRWLPGSLGDRYIVVNVPEMRLDVYDGNQTPLTMRTVVGKQDTQTPIFSDQMTHIVFSPYWNVPPGIAKEETLPSVMRDPGFLARNNMEVLDSSGNRVDPSAVDLSNPTAYRFRQRPGASNSLGLVKFMFPNQFNVYLHDTPADSLFDRAARSYSHGCVRVAEPVALAEYLLRDQPEWTRARIEEAMHAGDEKHVKLKNPIPVYLVYWTARVRPDSTVQFRKDIYGIDKRLSVALNDRLERLRRSSEAATAATTVKEPVKSGPAKGEKKNAKPAGR